jgi:hypothetical protein
MCRESKVFFIMLLVALLLSSVWGALHGQEQESWYLISETELQSIEQYREKSIAEKQSLLLQARQLSEESANLNRQLAAAREEQRRSERSFELFAQDQLTLLSSKNGEIEALSKQLADQKLMTANYRGIAASRLVVIAALIAAWVGALVFWLWRKFRR